MPHTRLRVRASAALACVILLCISAVARADSLTLAWDASSESQVTGYYVYLGTASGEYSTVVDVGTATQYTFADVQPGATYYLTVAAYAAGQVTGARAPELVTTIGAAPTLLNPGNRSSSRAGQVTLALNASDPDNEALTFTAGGLPPGLSLDAQTGLISGVPTTAGTFTVTITAADGSANVATQSFSWTIVAIDSAAPSVAITNPTSSTFSTTDAFATLSGIATDDSGVTSVRWANASGGSGFAAGTSNWSVVVPLQFGTNVLTITAIDAAGRSSSTAMTVTQVRLPEPVRITGLTSSRHGSGVAGVLTTFTATASGGLAPYQYKWWLFDGVSWSVLREWSEDGTLLWTPQDANASYRIAVWVRSAGSYANAPDNDASNVSIAFPVVNERRRR